MVVTPSPQLHFCATCGLSFEQRGAWEVRQGSMRHFLRTFHETRFENENKRGFARAHMITAHSDSPWAGSSYPLPSLHHDVHLPLKDGCSLPGQCLLLSFIWNLDKLSHILQKISDGLSQDVHSLQLPSKEEQLTCPLCRLFFPTMAR